MPRPYLQAIYESGLAHVGIFSQGVQAHQRKPQPVYAVEDAVEVRLVDNLPREDRLPASGLDLHPFKRRSQALAELAAYHYPVDRRCALLARHPPARLAPLSPGPIGQDRRRGSSAPMGIMCSLL
jgi:hypothetical protein